MKRAKLFKNGQSQAVRLPKEFRFEGSEVYVKETTEGVLLMPIGRAWDNLWRAIEEAQADFPARNQPTAQEQRERLR